MKTKSIVEALEHKVKCLEMVIEKIREWVQEQYQTDIPVDFFLELSSLQIKEAVPDEPEDDEVQSTHNDMDEEEEEYIPFEDMGNFKPEEIPAESVSLELPQSPNLPIKRKRGRPRKSESSTISIPSNIPKQMSPCNSSAKRKRGRPRKNSNQNHLVETPNEDPQGSDIILPPNSLDIIETPAPADHQMSSELPTALGSIFKRKRGRPRKYQYPASDDPIPKVIKEKKSSNKTYKKIEEEYTGERTQTGEYICPVQGCGKTFKKIKHMLTVHMLQHDPSKSKDFYCDTEGCGKSFYLRYQLNFHKRKFGHGAEMEKRPPKKYYLCTLCGKTLPKSYEYRHIEFHKNERKYKCEVCGAGFNIPQSLSKHRNIHTKDKVHMCDICGKTFGRIENMKTHRVQVHMDEKPWVCKWEGCGVSFKLKRLLILHERRNHLGEGNVPCEICSRKFHTYEGLRDHYARSHKEKGGPSEAPLQTPPITNKTPI